MTSVTVFVKMRTKFNVPFLKAKWCESCLGPDKFFMKQTKSIKSIYAHSPLWLQNIMLSTQGFFFSRRRMDARLGHIHLAQLRESQWWTTDQFHAYQNEKLGEHLKYAAKHIPYYSNLFKKEGIDPAAIKSVEDFSNIPLLEKSTVRERPLSFLRDGKPSRSWNEFFTSGTTGSPMKLYNSREGFTRVWSFVFRLREWAGLDDALFPRRVQFTGRDICPDVKIRPDGVYWRTNLPGNALLMSTTHLSKESVPGYVAAMNRFKPSLVDGYPSAILTVSRVARSLGLELPRPKAIITSAETLFESDRSEIEEAFGCKVFNQYASSDTGAFACDCGYGTLHINPEFGICEILNEHGEPALPGEEGEIVTTSFCNREQVFVRYRIGDRAIQGPTDVCACGRSMPRIREITGRVDDTLFIPDRGFVGRLDPVFKGISGVYEAQIVQDSLEVLKVKLVPAPDYNVDVEHALMKNLRMKVGTTIAVVVEKVGEIPRGPNGKFRSVVSRCKDKYPLSVA
jgi:phenylacetate-coenzyme A ligase PaaK-like adenylate-forming protein